MSVAREPTNGRPVFLYGSLLWESVLQVLLGRMPRARPALLVGFDRRRIRGERFPGIAEVDAGNGESAIPVRGLIFDDLTDREAAIFDEFEDPEYDKRLIKPYIIERKDWAWAQHPAHRDDLCLVENGSVQTVDALAYVWTERSALDDVLWLPSRDFVPYEHEYLQMCGTFVDEELPEELKASCLANGGGMRELRLASEGGTAGPTRKAIELLQGSAEAPAAGTVRLSALGAAMEKAARVAASLEAEGHARITRIATSYPEVGPESRRGSSAQMLIYLARGAA